MVKKVIKRLLHKRHHWRYMEFSELAELYASKILRTMALTMVSVFVAIFMYQSGYSLVAISVYFTLQYLLRAAFAFPAAYLIGYFGPKHVTLHSNLLYIPALLSLANLQHYGWITLVGYGLFQALSASMYNIAHHVDFSLVKHRKHAGKEIGYMVGLERFAMAVSPMVGGGIAYLFGPQATVVAAMILFTVAAAPLMLTPEPFGRHRRVRFRGFDWKLTRRSITAHGFIGWDFVASGLVWSLYAAVAIFGTTTNALYAQIGALASVSIVASVITIRAYGLLIDRHRGGELLRLGIFGSSFLHLFRPFLTTASGVIMMNTANEATKSAYNMPYLKGVFDMADDIHPYRIPYMAWLDFSISIGAAIAMATLGILGSFGSEIAAMQLFYIISAVVVLGTLTHGLRGIRIHG